MLPEVSLRYFSLVYRMMRMVGPSLQRHSEFSCEAAGSLVPGFCECSHRTSAVKAQPVILACCGKKFADRLSCGWRTLSQSAPFSIACYTEFPHAHPPRHHPLAS